RYVKGGRFTVDTYNDSTGELQCFEPSYYELSSGYLYWNDYRPRCVLRDVTVTMVDGHDKKGIEIRLAEGYADNITLNGFGRYGLDISSAFARINNAKIYASRIPSTTTGYSLQSSGLSDTVVVNSLLYGDRHAIACGDSGYWTSADAGV